MSNEYSIEVKDVEKHFKVYEDKGNMLKEFIIFANRNKHKNRQVLNGISFQVPKGQTLGLIGRNGCGKSTTLKLLTRILKPNEGSVTVKGRVSSLIELGAGFHPDMTGRENIYINATIFGLKKAEIDERLDSIIKFSELEKYIDNPVRTYSSGMYMRLAFAVAINVNADVLLIDEILAVGDVSFQKKCFERLREIKEEGTTIVIVSHAMDQLFSICDRLIWIDQGKIKEDGEPKPTAQHYLDAMEDERIERLEMENSEKLKDVHGSSILKLTKNPYAEARREGDYQVHFTKVDLFNDQGHPCRTFSTGDKVQVKFSYETKMNHPKVNFNMDISRDEQYCYGSCFTKSGDPLPVLNEQGEVTFHIEKLMLLPGKYYLSIGINGESGELYDHVRNVIQFVVREYPHNEFGPCTFEHSWEIE